MKPWKCLNKEAEFLSSHSHSAKVLFDMLRKFDAGLKKATDNNVDLKVLAPLGLAVYAFSNWVLKLPRRCG
jgi:hypothetical protein